MPDLSCAGFTALTSGNGVSLMSAISGPDLIAHGYVESELRAAGTAASYAGDPDAPYATRVVVRRPETGGSGTLVVEWLNVSSGSDAAPDWTYLAEEIVRRGHAWAGVSAQQVGVEGGEARVSTGGAALHTEETTTIQVGTAPVLVVQTEGDLFGRLNFLPARQPDAERLRLWEIAGAAHADYFQIGEFESFLGCPDPVNRGQQAYVVRAALRWLESWARGGEAAPSAPLLEVAGDGFVLDEHGNVRGGVRTPVVDAPADVLSGFAAPDASPICGLFGRTLPLARDPWSSREEYQAAYAAATDAAIAAGFVLAEDRDAVLAEAR